jgi:hypothetical protein
MATKKERHEVVLQIPESVGLNKDQVNSLKKAFKNQLVTSLGPKALAIRIIVVRVRIVFASQEF